MANYLSQPINYGMPMDVVNEDLINMVMATKQQKWDAHQAQLDATVAKLGQIKNYIYRPQDKQYLSDRYKEVVSAISSSVNGNLSKEVTARNLMEAVDGVLDNNVQNAIQSTGNMYNYFKQAEESKKDGKYNDANYLYGLKQIEAWQQDKIHTLGAVQYEPYTDYNSKWLKKLKEYADINGKRYKEETNPDGTKTITEMEGMTHEELTAFIQANMDSQDRRQLQIEGSAFFNSVDDLQQYMDKYAVSLSKQETDRIDSRLAEIEVSLKTADDSTKKSLEESKTFLEGQRKKASLESYLEKVDKVRKGEYSLEQVGGELYSRQQIDGFAVTWQGHSNIKTDKFLWDEYHKATGNTSTNGIDEYGLDANGNFIPDNPQSYVMKSSTAAGTELDKELGDNVSQFETAINYQQEQVNAIANNAQLYNPKYDAQVEKEKELLLKSGYQDNPNTEAEAQVNALRTLGLTDEYRKANVALQKAKAYQKTVVDASNDIFGSMNWASIYDDAISGRRVKGIFKSANGKYSAYTYEDIVRLALGKDSSYKVTGKDFENVLKKNKFYGTQMKKSILIDDMLSELDNGVNNPQDKKESIDNFTRFYNQMFGTSYTPDDLFSFKFSGGETANYAITNWNTTNDKRTNDIEMGYDKAFTQGKAIPEVLFKNKEMQSILQSAITNNTYSKGLSRDYGIYKYGSSKEFFNTKNRREALNLKLKAETEQLGADNNLEIRYQLDRKQTKEDESLPHKAALSLLSSSGQPVNKTGGVFFRNNNDGTTTVFQRIGQTNNKGEVITIPVETTLPTEEVLAIPELNYLLSGLSEYNEGIKTNVSIEPKAISFDKKSSEWGSSYSTMFPDIMRTSTNEKPVIYNKLADIAKNMNDSKLAEFRLNTLQKAIDNSNSFLISFEQVRDKNEVIPIVYIQNGQELEELTALPTEIRTPENEDIMYNAPEVYFANLLTALMTFPNNSKDGILDKINQVIPQ